MSRTHRRNNDPATPSSLLRRAAKHEKDACRAYMLGDRDSAAWHQAEYYRLSRAAKRASEAEAA
jgi:hypothetical protein